MSDSDDYVSQEIQTRLHVAPHIFNDENERALVTCDKSCQTAVTSFPDIEDRVFFSLLEFIPYKDIDRDAIRILDLPRKHRLHFKLPSDTEECESLSPQLSCCEKDYTKVPSKKVLKRKRFSAESDLSVDLFCLAPKTLEDEAQSTLIVSPHVLDEDQVAKVYTETPFQLATCPSVDNDENATTVTSSSELESTSVSETTSVSHTASAEAVLELLTRSTEAGEEVPSELISGPAEAKEASEVSEANEGSDASEASEKICGYYIICAPNGEEILDEGDENHSCSCKGMCPEDPSKGCTKVIRETKYIYCGCYLSETDLKSALQSAVAGQIASSVVYCDQEVQTCRETFYADVSVQTGEYCTTNADLELTIQKVITKDVETNIIVSCETALVEVSGSSSFSKVSSADHKVIRLPMINPESSNYTDNSFMSQPEANSLVGGESLSHEAQCIDSSTEMSSKIPVPLNRKGNCPSKQALCCMQGSQSSKGDNGGGKNDAGGNKRLICKIRIKTDCDTGTESPPPKAEEEPPTTKTVCVNTGDDSGDKKTITPAKEAVEAALPCVCKKSEPKVEPKKEVFIPLSEQEAYYYEHYVEELQCSTTGVQTELDNGSDSVDSLPGLPDSEWCGKGAELPWQKFVLSPPATYTIRSSKKEVKNQTQPSHNKIIVIPTN